MKDLTGCIYIIKNTLNSKCYIGQTNNFERRWKEHKHNAEVGYDKGKYRSVLYDAIRKYGKDVFVADVLEVLPLSSLEQREKYWISFLDTLVPNGYNLTVGGETLYGENNPFYGKVHSEETKALISKANKGRKKTEEWMDFMRESNAGEKNPFYGKTHSLATVKRIIASNEQTYRESSIRMKINNPHKNWEHMKPVAMYSLDGDFLRNFSGASDAAKFIKNSFPSVKGKENVVGNMINEVARGRRRKAYGYIWKRIEKGVSTIPQGSRMEDELPSEAQDHC